jgi:hypothetical protein
MMVVGIRELKTGMDPAHLRKLSFLISTKWCFVLERRSKRRECKTKANSSSYVTITP